MIHAKLTWSSKDMAMAGASVDFKHIFSTYLYKGTTCIFTISIRIRQKDPATRANHIDYDQPQQVFKVQST